MKKGILDTDALFGEQSLPRKRISKKRPLEIDGATWLRYSLSIWKDLKKSQTEQTLKHPAIFPAQLAKRLIEVFTFEEDIILDPFVGTGSTLVAAEELGRNSIGIDISKEFIRISKVRLSETASLHNNSKPAYKLIHDSAENLNNYIAPQTIGLCVTSPPYWDILTQKRTADYKEIRTYGGLKGDIGEIHDYKKFLSALGDIMLKVYQVLKPGKYCCIVVMDLRKKNRFYPLHMDLCDFMTNKIGFELDDIIIWDRGREYNNLRPLGHPFVFRINKIHEYILIFKK